MTMTIWRLASVPAHGVPGLAWLGTRKAKDHVAGAIRDANPLCQWLAQHVGDTTRGASHPADAAPPLCRGVRRARPPQMARRRLRLRGA